MQDAGMFGMDQDGCRGNERGERQEWCPLRIGVWIFVQRPPREQTQSQPAPEATARADPVSASAS